MYREMVAYMPVKRGYVIPCSGLFGPTFLGAIYETHLCEADTGFSPTFWCMCLGHIQSSLHSGRILTDARIAA